MLQWRDARSWNRRIRFCIIFGLIVVALIGLFSTSRVPLRAGYHDFADKRTMFGIPNFWDVISNVPFMISGLLGIWWTLAKSGRASFAENAERVPYVVFFTGVVLTGIGSFWYHLAPDNHRLPWDLMPMTFSFMSIVGVTVIERIDTRVGIRLYFPLVILGASSVVYWYMTESQGRGDYKFYLFVQFFSPVLLAVIVWLFPPRYSGTEYLVLAFTLFVLAKAMEALDWQIYAASGWISGHALKHATAGVACYWILLALQRRRPLTALIQKDTLEESTDFAPDHFRQL